jgi:iron(III) transport system ATP-binding protein
VSGVAITSLNAAHGRSQVLTDLDLSVVDGSLMCVLGPSGCGKSTLLRIIAGFHRPTSGRVVVGGRTLDDGRTRVPAERRRIGFVPQDGALFPHLSVAGNIGFGLPHRSRRARVAELLELVGLTGFADRHPHQLSGGQQQRVALARALAPRPELLLLDEPFAALDAALRTQVRAEVAATLRQAGATAILVTHDVDEALAFADTIAVLREGRIAQSGTPHALYHRPADADLARTLGEANLLPAQIIDGHAVTALGALRLTTEANHPGPGTVMLRPHQLRLAPTAAADTIDAEVTGCRFRGHDYRVELAPHPDHNGVDVPQHLVAYAATGNPPAIGQTAHLTVEGAVHPLHHDSVTDIDQCPVTPAEAV